MSFSLRRIAGGLLGGGGVRPGAGLTATGTGIGAGTGIDRDGSASLLERDPLAEGARGPAALEAVRAGAITAGGLSLGGVTEDGAPGRPGARIAVSERDLLVAGLSAKVLGNWIQNRHQTLYPLAMNFRNLAEAEVEILLETIAVSLLATGPLDLARIDRVYDWMKGVGANDTHRIRLAYAGDNAPALHALVARVLEARIGPLAYAVALAALDQRVSVNRLFLEYLAERLGLPSDMARSLAQRYRL